MSNNLPYTTTYNIEGLTNGNTTIEFTSSETTNYLSKKKTIDIVSSVEGDSDILVPTYQIDSISNYPEYALFKEVETNENRLYDYLTHGWYDMWVDNSNGDLDMVDIIKNKAFYPQTTIYVINPKSEPYIRYLEKYPEILSEEDGHISYAYYVTEFNNDSISNTFTYTIETCFYVKQYTTLYNPITTKSYIKFHKTWFPFNLPIIDIGPVELSHFLNISDEVTLQDYLYYFIDDTDNCFYILLKDDFVTAYNNARDALPSSTNQWKSQYFNFPVTYNIPNTTVTVINYIWDDLRDD